MLSKLLGLSAYLDKLGMALQVATTAALLVEEQDEKKGAEKKAEVVALIKGQLDFDPKIEDVIIPIVVEIAVVLLKQSGFLSGSRK